MRQEVAPMKKSTGDIFSNPEYLYKALQNTTTEFFEDDTMDFYDQVYPRLLRNILDEAIIVKALLNICPL